MFTKGRSLRGQGWGRGVTRSYAHIGTHMSAKCEKDSHFQACVCTHAPRTSTEWPWLTEAEEEAARERMHIPPVYDLQVIGCAHKRKCKGASVCICMSCFLPYFVSARPTNSYKSNLKPEEGNCSDRHPVLSVVWTNQKLGNCVCFPLVDCWCLPCWGHSTLYKSN